MFDESSDGHHEKAYEELSLCHKEGWQYHHSSKFMILMGKFGKAVVNDKLIHQTYKSMHGLFCPYG
jgi:hypothetical protein